MSRSFLTGINLNKNELLNARIQNLALAPSSPVAGQIYYDTTDSTLRYWNGTAWLTLAQGGDLSGAISAAINALTTDDIEQGTTNKYYADSLVDSHLTGGDGISYSSGTIAAELLSNGGLGFSAAGLIKVDRTTVDTWYDASGAAATAQTSAVTSANGYTDTAIGNLTTDTVTEGTTNKYFSDELAQDAVGNAVGTGLTYNDSIGAIEVDTTTIATKTYVDGVAQGLNVKDSVLAATTANIALDGSVTTVDGVSVTTGDRVLVKNQSTAADNGIYVVNSLGWVRATDQAAPEKGDYTFVEAGTQAARGFIVTTAPSGPIVEVIWTQFSAAGEYTAGDGISISGNTIAADLDGSTSGLSLGAGGLSVNVGTAGIGKSILDGALYVITGTGVTLDGITGAVKLDTANGYGVRKYAENNGALSALGGAVTWDVSHNFGTKDVTVQVYEISSGSQVEVDVVHTSNTKVTLTWVSGDVSADAYRVVVVG